MMSFFSLLQSIRVSIFYGLELVFKVSFKVRIRIRINKVMSVWQLTTTVAAILVLPIRHSGGFIFVGGCILYYNPFIYRSVTILLYSWLSSRAISDIFDGRFP